MSRLTIDTRFTSKGIRITNVKLEINKTNMIIDGDLGRDKIEITGPTGTEKLRIRELSDWLQTRFDLPKVQSEAIADEVNHYYMA